MEAVRALEERLCGGGRFIAIRFRLVFFLAAVITSDFGAVPQLVLRKHPVACGADIESGVLVEEVFRVKLRRLRSIRH